MYGTYDPSGAAYNPHVPESNVSKSKAGRSGWARMQVPLLSPAIHGNFESDTRKPKAAINDHGL